CGWGPPFWTGGAGARGGGPGGRAGSRSDGRPGGAVSARPTSAVEPNSACSWRSSTVLPSSTIAGVSGSAGSRRCAYRRTRPAPAPRRRARETQAGRRCASRATWRFPPVSILPFRFPFRPWGFSLPLVRAPGTHGLPATTAAQPISGWPLFFPWARGFARLPLSFLPLAMRGLTRREDALSGSRRTAPTITPDGPGSPDPGASADAPRQLGAPRGIYRFRVHGQSDRPAVFVPRGGFPSAARG